MSGIDKSLIAAVLAVRNGRLPAEKAAELVSSPRNEGETRPAVEDVLEAAGDDVSPSLVDAIAEELGRGGDLADLGLDETTVRTLSQLGQGGGGRESVHDTLLSISPTRIAKDAETIDASDYADPGTETSSPTVRPPDFVTTKRPSSQILRAVPRQERYEVVKEHARGGMGRILLARDNVVGREVAVKELLPGMSGSGGSAPANSEVSQGITERFLREAKVTGQLEHPNIVSVYEIGKNDDGSLYYTMKFVRGQTLADRIQEFQRDSTLDKKEQLAARLKLLDNFVDVCNAIAYAHSKGVIHRDLKPENVMLGEYGETVVLDWGLARVRGQEDTVAQKLIDSTRYMSQSIVENETNKLTMDGSIVGTPAYMSPEQARGELDEIDEQSDVYALGAVLYQILSGRAPYEGPAPALVIQQVLNSRPMRLSAAAPDVPPELEALVERAMAKEKEDRLASAREFASEIKAFRDGRTLSSYSYSMRELVARWMSKHRRAVIAGMIFLYVLVAGAVFHYVQLRNEKAEVERQSREADNARRTAQNLYADALDAGQEAARERDRADRLRAEAEESKQRAEREAEEKESALQGWGSTLADAYAMRVRLAVENRDYNGAMAFIGAALKSDEQPEARGGMLSLPRVFPLLWELAPDGPSTQEVYEFYDVAFSPDGTLVATGHSDGLLRVWSMLDGSLVQKLRVGEAQCSDMAFSPSGELLAASSLAGVIRLFRLDREAGQYVENDVQPAPSADPDYRVSSLAFSPDGTKLAATRDRLWLWDTETGALLGAFEGGGDHVPLTVSFSPDGRTIATATPQFSDLFVQLWDVDSLSLRRSLIDMTGVNEVFTAWSSDGKWLASSSLQGQIRIRDAESLRIVKTLTAHTSSVLDLEFSPDASNLLSCGADGTLRLWDTDEFETQAVITGFSGIVQSIAFAPDGRSFAARDDSGAVYVWGVSEGDTRSVRGHSSDVLDVRFSRDGSRFVTVGWDGAVIVWDAQSREPVREWKVPLEQFFCADFLDDGRVVAGGGNGLRVWNVDSGELKAHIAKGKVVTDIDIAPDRGSFIAAWDRQATRIDALSLETQGEYGRHKQLCVTTRQSPDGRYVATGGFEGRAILWGATTNEPVRAVQQGKGSVFTVAFSPDSSLMAAGGDDQVVRVYSVPEGRLLHTLEGHEGLVFSLAFGKESGRLFSGSQDRTIRVWDLDEGRALAVLKGHDETVTRLAVAPDGQTLLSASQDESVRQWPLESLDYPRERFGEIARALTGLDVADKQFVPRTLDDWPAGLDRPGIVNENRRRRAGQIGRFAAELEAGFEGYRYVEKPVDGRRVRRYLPPRERDVDGNLVGEPQGRVNTRWYLADRREGVVTKLRAPVVTEITDHRQAGAQPLKKDDLVWRVNEERVTDRDGLREKLDEVGDEPFTVTIRRYRRDEQGNPVAATDDAGNYLLDEGRTFFEFDEFEITLQPGKLGLRIGDGEVPERPLQ